MSVKQSKGRKNKKKKSLLAMLLYLVSALFLIWLLWILFLTSVNPRAINHENPFADMFSSISKNEKDPTEKQSRHTMKSQTTDTAEDMKPSVKLAEQAEGIEFEPSMQDILEDKEFDRKKFEAMFENMKAPRIPETKRHSTFGKDVVYIYHSHSRESFLPYFTNTYKPEEAYHSKENITKVGEMLGKALERRGMGSRVDSSDIVKELDERGLDFTDSYRVSKEHVLSARKDHKDLEIFLDIHRDSVRKNSTTAMINGTSLAKLFFVVGTGHENYEKNLAFAEDLQQKIAARYSGLSKGIILKDQSQGNGVYNQDVSPNSVIVEIGGVDNTANELYGTTEILAEVLSDNYWHGAR